MAHTKRTTTILDWREGFTGEEPLQSTPKETVCQTFDELVTVTLRPDGREVFLPALRDGRVYEATICGVCTYYWHVDYLIFTVTKKERADARYRQNRVGNFAERHGGVSLDGIRINAYFKEEVAELAFREDREAHWYRFRIDGSAKKMAVRFQLDWRPEITRTEGALALTMKLLPEGTPSPLPALQAFVAAEKLAKHEVEVAEERAKTEAVAAEKRRQAEAEAARKEAICAENAAEERAALASSLESLGLRVHCDAHFLDPEFQENYARHHMQKVLDVDRQIWTREYAELMQEHDLVRLAKAEAPDVITWFEARLKIVQLAERFAVAPPSEPKVEAPKPKRNAAQVREMKLHREAVQTDDKIALAKQKAEKLLEAKEQLEEVPLEPEERERIETELIEEILESEVKNNGEATTTL